MKIKKSTPICVKSHQKDSVTSAFSVGCSGTILTVDEIYSVKNIKSPLVIRGLRNMSLLKPLIKEKGLDYYFIDTGYFGNYPKKKFHRITKNRAQQVELKKRPSWRLDMVQDLEVLDWKRKGKHILLCPPSPKSIIYFYGWRRINKKYKGSPQYAVEMWTESTIKKLKKHTKRPIKIREKPRMKVDRHKKNPFKACVLNDVFATVTFNSIVAVESIINGVPAFVCAENAAMPVAKTDLTHIERPLYAKRKAWLRSLSFGQFTVPEIESGLAWAILNERPYRYLLAPSKGSGNVK